MNDESTHTTLPTDTVRSRAEKLLQERLVAIGGLEEAVAALEEAKGRLAAAESDLNDAVSKATAAGWNSSELSQLGIPVAAGSARRSASGRSPASGRRSKRGTTAPDA